MSGAKSKEFDSIIDAIYENKAIKEETYERVLKYIEQLLTPKEVRDLDFPFLCSIISRDRRRGLFEISDYLRDYYVEKTNNNLGRLFYSDFEGLYTRAMQLNEINIASREEEFTNGPLVTIITPTYKRYSELQRAVSQVKHQTYTNWEMLVCSDGDDPKVREIVDKANDKRIKYHHTEQTNDYGATQRNEMVKIANGEYTLYLDDDVAIHPRNIELRVEAAVKWNADIVFSKIWHNFSGFIPYGQGDAPQIERNRIDGHNILVKTEIVKRHKWNQKYGHDYIFVSDVMKDCKKTENLQCILGHHDPMLQEETFADTYNRTLIENLKRNISRNYRNIKYRGKKFLKQVAGR